MRAVLRIFKPGREGAYKIPGYISGIQPPNTRPSGFESHIYDFIEVELTEDQLVDIDGQWVKWRWDRSRNLLEPLNPSLWQDKDKARGRARDIVRDVLKRRV